MQKWEIISAWNIKIDPKWFKTKERYLRDFGNFIEFIKFPISYEIVSFEELSKFLKENKKLIIAKLKELWFNYINEENYEFELYDMFKINEEIEDEEWVEEFFDLWFFYKYYDNKKINNFIKIIIDNKDNLDFNWQIKDFFSLDIFLIKNKGILTDLFHLEKDYFNNFQFTNIFNNEILWRK